MSRESSLVVETFDGWRPRACDTCGEMIEKIDHWAAYGGPYGGRNIFKRLWYRGRWVVGDWHIWHRPEWANPWRFQGPISFYGP